MFSPLAPSSTTNCACLWVTRYGTTVENSKRSRVTALCKRREACILSGKPRNLSQGQTWDWMTLCCLLSEKLVIKWACLEQCFEKFYANSTRNGCFSTGDYEIDVVTSATLMSSPKNFILCLVCSHKGHVIPMNRGGHCVCLVMLRLSGRKPCSSNLIIPNFSSFFSSPFCGFSYFIPLTEITS